MTPLLRALKATYNFFAGDVILIVAVALAFILAAILTSANVPNALLGVLFVACIAGGLATTLGRERRAK